MTPAPLTFRQLRLDFTRPTLMAIFNVTPDSFSDGGCITNSGDLVARARRQIAAGAAILDVGGESTRPGAEPVDVGSELARVLPAIEALTQAHLPAVISIDTSKAEVARAAIAAGAEIVNDVTALGDPEMGGVVAHAGAGLVLMHMRGQPRTMQEGPIVYDDVVEDVLAFLRLRLARAVAAGVPHERIMVDPGIGFGKNAEHNLSLTKHIGALGSLGCPIVYGPSRKRFLGEITGQPVQERERATAAACALAVYNGAHVLRVHDVGAVHDAVLVAKAAVAAP